MSYELVERASIVSNPVVMFYLFFNEVLQIILVINKGKCKDVPVLFNWAPRHEGVLGEWKYGSTHSLTSALDW